MTRILRAFWHRTRATFVPLTLEEVCRRAKVSPDEAHSALRSMASQGLAASHNGDGRGQTSSWHLTDYGKHMTRQMMQQQERLQA